MTVARFDAPASKSPAYYYTHYPHALREGIAFRLVRLIWLTARFARREPVTVADYRLRFGVSLRSFRRDIALLRQAGFQVESSLDGTYRVLCFVFDADHA
jgi:hypothetical protein